MRFFILFVGLFLYQWSWSQTPSKQDVLEMDEFLFLIKQNHPLVKQANLKLNESEAKVLYSRGSFDPKLAGEFNGKEFEQSNYYKKWLGYFKIPTWYGIEIKAQYEDNLGEYLNPENKTAKSGLYSLGISIPVLQNLVIDERRAMLKQAKLYVNQTAEENKLKVNSILYQAKKSYYYWVKSYQELMIYDQFCQISKGRLNQVNKGFEYGELSALDTTEAYINYENQKLNKEKARLSFRKASLKLSNYLWVDNYPLELKPEVVPDVNSYSKTKTKYRENEASLASLTIESHPKLKALDIKKSVLKIEERLALNKRLPQLNLNYNVLNSNIGPINTYSHQNYKAGVSFSYSLLTRKERAKVKLVKYKKDYIDFEKSLVNLNLSNKIKGLVESLASLLNQIETSNSIVERYKILYKGELRKFEFGDSSLFYVNVRETKFLNTKLKNIKLKTEFLNKKAELLKTKASENLK